VAPCRAKIDTLVALRRLLAQLIPLLAACLFRVELRAYLRAVARRLPPADESQGAGKRGTGSTQDTASEPSIGSPHAASAQGTGMVLGAASALGTEAVHPLLRELQALIVRNTARLTPEGRLLFLRKIKNHRNNYRNRDRANDNLLELSKRTPDRGKIEL
jgi:hypothetical protein